MPEEIEAGSDTSTLPLSWPCTRADRTGQGDSWARTDGPRREFAASLAEQGLARNRLGQRNVTVTVRISEGLAPTPRTATFCAPLRGRAGGARRRIMAPEYPSRARPGASPDPAQPARSGSPALPPVHRRFRRALAHAFQHLQRPPHHQNCPNKRTRIKEPRTKNKAPIDMDRGSFSSLVAADGFEPS